jgi:ribosomal protein S18 acetylase RimI-like enzyme
LQHIPAIRRPAAARREIKKVSILARYSKRMHDVRLLTGDDTAEFRAFRLAALEESPKAFGESPEEFRASTIEGTAQRIGASDGSSFVLGAFVGGRLAGTAGFFRHTGRKRRHKGHVWGVYVDPSCRKRGIARSLMEALIARVRKVEDLRQVSLSVSTTQPAARSLYASVGFQLFGLERRALQVGREYVDEEHYVLMLDEPG